jgi:hypothetical protein
VPLLMRQHVGTAWLPEGVPARLHVVMEPSLPFIPRSLCPSRALRIGTDGHDELVDRDEEMMRSDSLCPSPASYLFTLACVKPIAQ